MNFDRVAFWTDPTRAGEELRRVDRGRMVKFCQPDFYLNHTWGQRIAATVFPSRVGWDWSVLEIGCNTGKTLAYLYDMGYRNLTGVEINRKALDIGRRHFPDLEHVELICSAIENVINLLHEFDVIYAGGVYMHLPYELDWVFDEIAKKARRLILTAENELDTDFYRFARNYKTVFESRGWTQVEEESGANFPPLPASTVKRVFVK